VGDARQDEALDVLRAGLDRIAGMEDSPEKTDAIRDLAGPLTELAARATAMRRAEVLRLRRQEMFSLGKTAERVGISKARADQIERDERKKQEAPDGHGIPDGAGRAAGLRGG
jgi:predicted DNA-binding protein (UPF0251 family)